MISYHESPPDAEKSWNYASGFKTVNTRDLNRVSNGISGFVWSPIVWINGVRLQKNFLVSHFLALDFDSPYYELSTAYDDFEKFQVIIGVTKSHQQWKEGTPPCDRFRIVIPWSEPITDLRTYRYNLHMALHRFPMADQACRDGARFFFPCKEIMITSAAGRPWTVHKKVPAWFEPDYTAEEYRNHCLKKTHRVVVEGLRPWVREFLMSGTLIRRGGRNNSCYAVALELIESGFSEDEIASIIEQAPFSRDNWRKEEVRGAIRSAFKSFQKYATEGTRDA